MSPHWKRSRYEAVLALLFALAIIVAGLAVVSFFLTISPGYSDPSAVPSRAAAAPAARHASAVAEARRLARALVVEENLPALSVAVAVDGDLAWVEAFGLADVEQRTPVTPETTFRVGSVARPLTAAALGLLYERGRLDLDRPVQQYVPGYPKKPWPVTVRQLMGDVAGVHHLVDGSERMPGRRCDDLDDALRIFRDDPLAFRPGTQYRYSTYGWVLLSAVIEGISGEPFAAFMAREVFGPSGMRSTIPDGDTAAGRASFYFPRMAQNTALGIERAPLADYSCYAGAGTFVSTPTDLARFGSAMLKPGLLKAETIAMLQAAQRLESGASTGFALGWKVDTLPLAGAPARMVGHRASAMGGTTSFMTFPDRGLVVAVVSNVSYAEGVAPLTLKIADAFARLAGPRASKPN
jgi:CubicO group peptidase (beta-lactamase class C family)